MYQGTREGGDTVTNISLTCIHPIRRALVPAALAPAPTAPRLEGLTLSGYSNASDDHYYSNFPYELFIGSLHINLSISFERKEFKSLKGEETGPVSSCGKW